MSYKADLTNKVVIITGSSKGIGASMARALAQHGAHVIISSRSQEAVDNVAQQIKADGYEAHAIACHVGDQEQLENLVEKTITKYGGIDILINNAAINPVYGPLSESDITAFDKVMNINVKACMSLSNLCYPHMVSRGGGSIINIASVEGLKPSSGLGLYSMSKAALIMLTKSQAKEWGPQNIRSNAICPGLIQTKLSAGIWQDEKTLKAFTIHVPLKRMAQPDEMAGLAVYLASNQSSYTTGGMFTSDGGYMLA